MAGEAGEAGREARGLAIKVEDGDAAHRARNVITVAALRELGVLDAAAVEGRLAEFAAPPVLDPRGAPSGEMRAAVALPSADR
jgi:L-asparaginase II